MILVRSPRGWYPVSRGGQLSIQETQRISSMYLRLVYLE